MISEINNNLYRKSKKLAILCVTDEFFKREKEISKEPVPQLSKDEKDLAAIRILISNWRKAWQGKDIKKYMKSYSKDFASQGLDRVEWEKHKSNINKQRSQIRINISNLKIELVAPDKAQAHFDQDYYADEYNDRGKKTIKLIKKNGEWKIQGEIWTPITR